jgi:hypothetical protein
MITRRPLLKTLIAAALATCAAGSAWADAPAGKVVLTINGKLGNGAEGHVDFDMAMLEKLPQHSFTTATPWYPQAKTFTGPLLRDVLAAAAAKGTTLRFVALNDYKIDMPAEDADRYGVIVARLLDGQPMAVREKGPLFVVYPYDSKAELRSERYYSRSAWQLRTIDVR